jgi:hypothetical protein
LRISNLQRKWASLEKRERFNIEKDFLDAYEGYGVRPVVIGDMIVSNVWLCLYAIYLEIPRMEVVWDEAPEIPL